MADFDWLGAGAQVLGGLLGGSSASSGGGSTQTATKEPWAEAAPWLKNQIAQGQQLQNYYQKTPFNSQQQTAYGNTFADLDNFRSQTAPGLMQFANNAMTGSYQRQPVSRPGMGAGYGGAASPSALPGSALAGPFSMAQGTAYGAPNFAASGNPFTNGAVSPQVPASLLQGGLTGTNSQAGAGNDGRGDSAGNDGPGNGMAGSLGSIGGLLGGMGSFGGFGDATLNASNSTKGEGISKGAQSAISAVAGMLGLGPLGSMIGPGLNAAMSQGSYNGYGGLDGTTTAATGPGTIGSRDSYGSNESSSSYGGGDSTDASSAGATNGSDSNSDSYGGSGAGGWAKGGAVTADRLGGPDPAGADDGYGALDAGEFVVRTAAVKKYGSAVMDALNAGKIDPAALRALLNPKNKAV